MAEEGDSILADIYKRMADLAAQQAAVTKSVDGGLSAMIASSAGVQAKLDGFDQFSETQMKVTVDMLNRMDGMAAQLAAMQQDLALIKESLVALTSTRH